MNLNLNIQNLDLTPLEKQTLQVIIDGLYAEPGFSDMDVNDIARPLGKSTRVLRGVLSSLIKKDYIQIDGNDSGYQIIYLNESRYYLHPEWKDESPWFENPEEKTYEQLHNESLNK